MSPSKTDPQGGATRAVHADFDVGFVHAALILALTVGFGSAAVLGLQLGFDLPANRWWPTLVQIHGHAQVFGWLGLFIMGVSLHFIPRFAGAALPMPALARWIWILLSFAVVGRCGQLALSATVAVEVRFWGRWVLAAAGVAEILAVLLYVLLLGLILRSGDPRRQAIRPLLPYFLSALCGWLGASAVIGVQTVRAAALDMVLVDPQWQRFGLDLFVSLVLIPIAFAFSIRTFPLYLRLPAVRWPVQRLVAVYLFACGLEIASLLAALLGWPGEWLTYLQPLGKIVKGAAIVVFVWRLDLLRRRPPWTVEREGEPPAQRRMHPQPRTHLPDYGEFGHFEWLIYAAYIWLVAAGGLEVYSGIALGSGAFAPCAPGVLQHVYLAGYATLLLLGMAPRMIPGFLHLRRLAFPRLVDVSFWLANAAILFRLLPLLLADGMAGPLAYFFGLSGLLGWLAVLALAVNLWATLRRRV